MSMYGSRCLFGEYLLALQELLLRISCESSPVNRSGQVLQNTCVSGVQS